MTRPTRTDAGVAAAGLFSHATATGGLATREPAPVPTRKAVPRAVVSLRQRIRQGAELLIEDVNFLRELGRPERTGQRRSLGSKFVATGVLTAAIRLLRERGIDMHGIEAGDDEAIAQRAYEALSGTAAQWTIQ